MNEVLDRAKTIYMSYTHHILILLSSKTLSALESAAHQSFAKACFTSNLQFHLTAKPKTASNIGYDLSIRF